jgi:hypothetical protein
VPDPLAVLEVLAATAAAAAAVLLLCGLPWRAPHPGRLAAGWVLGVGAGFYLGCRLLGPWPDWPPREDQARLLYLLFPAALGVELLAAFLGRLRWLAWPLRLLVAAGAGRVLLHDTTFLTDAAGTGAPEWTPAQAWLTLGGMAAVLAAVWALLAWRARRGPGFSVVLALALTCAGAAVTVMLSGYATGGQLGLPLAAALAGAAVASLALSGRPGVTAALGPGVVGLFAVVVIGHFFGELTWPHAALLFFAPLLCWLTELPYLRRLGPRLRGLLQVVMVAVPVAVAVVQARQKFAEDSRPSPGASEEPSLQDYMDFGK